MIKYLYNLRNSILFFLSRASLIWLIHANEPRHHMLNNKISSNNQPYTIIKLKNNVNPSKPNDQPHNVTISYTSNHQTSNLATNTCQTPKHKTKRLTHTTNNHMQSPLMSMSLIIHTIPPHHIITLHQWTPKHPTAKASNHCLTFLHHKNHCFISKMIQYPNSTNHIIHS